MDSNNSTSQTNTCGKQASTEWIITTVYLIIIFFLTVCGNLLVILVVVRYRKLQEVTNYFIVSLAIADLLIAATTLPLTIHVNIHNGFWCLSLPACGFWLAMDATCTFASIANLAAISIDRLIAITMPLRYRDIVTSSRVFLVITAIWLFCIVWGCLVLLDWTNPKELGVQAYVNGVNDICKHTEPIYYTVSIVIAFFVPLLIIITAYTVILKVAITQAKAVAALNPNRDQEKKSFFRETKATKMVALVIGAFVISWLPVFILLLISLWDPESTKKFRENKPKAHKFVFFTFIRVLPPLNSCVNPIIYAVFNKNFRSAFKLFLCRFKPMKDDMNLSMISYSTRMSLTRRKTSLCTVLSDTDVKENTAA